MTAVRNLSGAGHDFQFTGIDGQPLPLAQFRGNAVLIVNTASECDFAAQYQDLQLLWIRYRDLGLTVIGVPSNDFGQQEPGSEPEIKQFCESTYGVDFPLTAKEKVAGEEAHPFYQWAAQEGGEPAQPRWNFHKLLIGPYGDIAGAWPSQIKPLDRSVIETIESIIGTRKTL